MSEIRETTTVETITVPEIEPVLSFAQLLANIGPLTRAAAVVARSENRFLSLAKADSVVTSLSRPHLGNIIRDAKTANEAIQLLAGEIPLSVSLAEADQWKGLLRKAGESNDKLSLARAVAEISDRQQRRVQLSILTITQKVLAGRGFTNQTTNVREGLIEARRPGSTQTMTIDCSRSKSGKIEMKFDLDGFYGGACIDTLNEVQEDLAKAGVGIVTTSRRRKDPRPQYDGARVPLNAINLNRAN